MEFTNSNPAVPFIRLPPPFENIIITPPRYGDGSTVIEIMANPVVYMNLEGPPFPYTQESWQEWYPIIAKLSSDSLAEYYAAEEARKRGEKRWIKTALPVCMIREVDRATGDEKFLGACDVRFRGVPGVENEKRKRMKEINEGYEAGDPRIEREIGFYISPSVHGRGIMPVVLNTLMEKLMIPYMNIHQMNGDYYVTNKASRRVFEKCGFTFSKELPDLVEIPEAKSGVKGMKVGLGVMSWKRKLEQS